MSTCLSLATSGCLFLGAFSVTLLEIGMIRWQEMSLERGLLPENKGQDEKG
jgi:hypothetical protein